MVLSVNKIAFEPNHTAFEIVVLNAFDQILEVVTCVPRVENKLYTSERRKKASKAKLKPVIADEIIEAAKAKVLHAFIFAIGTCVDVWWFIYKAYEICVRKRFIIILVESGNS